MHSTDAVSGPSFSLGGMTLTYFGEGSVFLIGRKEATVMTVAGISWRRAYIEKRYTDMQINYSEYKMHFSSRDQWDTMLRHP